MKVLRDLKGWESSFVILTGDGREEYRIMVSLGDKFDGEDIIWFPKAPLGRKRTGLPVYNVVRRYPEKYGINSFLVLVDNEHIESLDEIENHLLELGVEIKNIVEQDRALLIEGRYGNRNLSILTAVLGETERIEEEIAKLMELEFNVKVEPKKYEIKKMLRKEGLNKGDLIEKASRENLEKAFPSLFHVLKRVKVSS